MGTLAGQRGVVGRNAGAGVGAGVEVATRMYPSGHEPSYIGFN